MFGVRRSSNAARQDKVIAGAFAFDMQSPGGEPDERVEPVQGAGELSQQLSENITTFDVSKFVQEHRSQLLVGPVCCRDGKHESRAENTPNDWDRFVGMKQQRDILADAERGAGSSEGCDDLIGRGLFFTGPQGLNRERMALRSP